MIVKLLAERHFESLSLKGGFRGSYESTHVKMPHCWKSHVTAHRFSHHIYTCIVKTQEHKTYIFEDLY